MNEHEFELLAAFGPGVEVINVVTGDKHRTPGISIKVTPRTPTGLAPARPRLAVRVQPRKVVLPIGAPTLSPLPHDERSHKALSTREAAEEVRVAYAIIAEMLPRVGLTIAQTNIRVTTNRRFKGRMGDARTFGYRPEAPAGVIRLSASALWRRASPEERRNTVIHELAHILANCSAKRNVGHGRVWKSTMIRLGLAPKRCHAVDRTGLRRGNTNASRVVNPEAEALDFNIGDLVTFISKKGEKVTGHVERYLRKNLVIRPVGASTYWTVSPALLTKVRPDLDEDEDEN